MKARAVSPIRVAALLGRIQATEQEAESVVHAANQMLAFERWARENPSDRKSQRAFPGLTADAVIESVVGHNVQRWAQLAVVALELRKAALGAAV